MASDTSTATYIYKRKYHDGKPANSAVRFHPTLQLIKKSGKFEGHDANGTYYYVMKSSNPQGVSGSFTEAQETSDGTNTGADGASSGLQFGASDVVKYGVIRLDGRSLNKARSKAGAFVNLVSWETEGIINEMGNTLAFELFRDGNGDRGRRSSISSDTVTLTTADDARNFDVGMVVIASANEDGSSPRTGHAVVTKVNLSAGTITLDDESDITSFADNDYLFRIGDPGTCVDGFESLLPLASPSAGESHRGVDRSAYPEKYAGSRIDDTSTPIEENAGLVAVNIASVAKGRATHLVLNPVKFWEVCRRLNAKVEYQGGGGKAGYGFEGFMIHTPAGSLMAISDPDCPPSRGYVLNMSDFEWLHIPGAPWIHPIKDDKGGMFLRVYNADAIEGRLRSDGQMFMWDGACSGVFSI